MRGVTIRELPGVSDIDADEDRIIPVFRSGVGVHSKISVRQLAESLAKSLGDNFQMKEDPDGTFMFRRVGS